MWLFLAFVAVPMIEIALFITVGGWIGLWPTLAIVVATALAGSALMRSQGMRALARLRDAMEAGRMPARELADGAAIVFAGALLLTPGFFTDTVGLLLMLPPVRAALFRFLASRLRVKGSAWHAGTGPRPAGEDIIEGSWHETESKTGAALDPSSGKSRH